MTTFSQVAASHDRSQTDRGTKYPILESIKHDHPEQIIFSFLPLLLLKNGKTWKNEIQKVDKNF